MLVTYAKKTYYDGEISYIEKKVTDRDHDKYVTTSEFNKLTAKKKKKKKKKKNAARLT